MRIKFSYSKKQLEDAVKFISKNNKYFIGQNDVIREDIISDMGKLLFQIDRDMISNMGYYILADRDFEGLYEYGEVEENIVNFTILVDPSLSKNDYSNIIEEVVIGKPIYNKDTIV